MSIKSVIANRPVPGSTNWLRWQIPIGAVPFIILAIVAPMNARADEVVVPSTPASAPVKPIKQKKRAGAARVSAPAASVARIAAPAASAAHLDAIYGYKGWNIPFPSFADTVTQNAGGFRSALADAGFGLTVLNAEVVQANMLNTPREVPRTYPACNAVTRIGGICAGNQAYFGQSFGSMYQMMPFLTYDLGRVGLTGGQLAVGANVNSATNENSLPNGARFSTLSWYQPLFDGKLEAKVGWFSTSYEVIGTFVAGNFTSPFGASASIPAELGLAAGSLGAPAVRLKWNISNSFYNQFLVQRSFPVNGPTGNPIYDEFQSNGVGLNFNSPIKGTGVLYLDEVGYQTPALPGEPSTWVRLGAMYNTSEFRDLSQLATAGTKAGVPGFYLLADRQLWQQDPSSAATAYRGIYVGGTAMYTPPETAAFYQYYEGRLYWIGPFNSRPQDMISLVYYHNEISGHLADFVNSFGSVTRIGANQSTNTIVGAYTAKLAPGVTASLGVSYTDHPSVSYFRGEGSAMNVIGCLFVFF